MVVNTALLHSNQDGRFKLLYHAYLCIRNVPSYSVLLKKVCSDIFEERLQEYQEIFIVFHF